MKLFHALRRSQCRHRRLSALRSVVFQRRILLECLEKRTPLAANVFTVNSTADFDSDPTKLTLREAIMAANATKNLDEPDRIIFAIPASDPGHVYYQNDGAAGQVSTAKVMPTTAASDSELADADPEWSHSWFTIQVQATLPSLNEAVIIDGFTQPGAKANTQSTGSDAVLRIELDGSGASSNASGLVAAGDGNTIRGLAINRFRGSIAQFSGYGIYLNLGDNNVIEGNFIGTDISGAMDLGNATEGIFLRGSSNSHIGGTTPAARNVISGNNNNGISFFLSSASSNVIQGNYIGLDALGTKAVPNANSGVSISGGTSSITIGGTAPGAGNVISGNGTDGISMTGLGGSHVIQGNFIGTDASGTADLGNAHSGARVEQSGILIGGTTPAARNVISGNNERGVLMSGTAATGNMVQGNYIGTNAAGAGALGNTAGGIQIANANDNVIGGTVGGAGNTIAFNGAAGVSVLFAQTGTGNAILGNRIFSNTSLGIDLGSDGVTSNDLGDIDTGANNRQNFPVLTSVQTTANSTTIAGSLNSTPNTQFHVEFFANAAADGSGFGEGQIFLGATDVSTDANGNVDFNANLSIPVLPGQFIAATATVRRQTDSFGDTSEFSQTATVPGGAAGEIHGRVWNDLDADGQPATDEPGLPGWGVFLDEDSDGIFDSNERSTTTDQEGNYAFTGLASGVYNVGQITRPHWQLTTPVFIPEQIYVAVQDVDFLGNNWIEIFNRDLVLQDTVSYPDLAAGQVYDVEIGPGGDVYVAVDTGEGEIIQFNYLMEFIRVIELPADSPPDPDATVYPYPYGFDVLADGSLLVAQPNNERIEWLNSDGTHRETFNLRGFKPRDAGMTSDGFVAMADALAGEEFLNVRPDDLIWVGRGDATTVLRDVAGTEFDTIHHHTFDALETADGTLYATSFGFSLGDVRPFSKLLQVTADQVSADGVGNYVKTGGEARGLAVARNEVPFGPELLSLRNEAVSVAPASLEHVATGLGTWSVQVQSGQISAGVDFGVVQLSTASGQKFEDSDGDHIKDPDEPGLDGWAVYVDLDDDGIRDGREPFAITHDGGLYTIEDIPVGTWHVREELKPDWKRITPATGFYEVRFSAGSAADKLDFGNQPCPADWLHQSGDTLNIVGDAQANQIHVSVDRDGLVTVADDDCFHVFTGINHIVADMKAGGDSLTFSAPASGALPPIDVNVAAGSGNDQLVFQNWRGDLTLDLGDGDDAVSIEQYGDVVGVSSATPKLSIVAGEGDDTVNFKNSSFFDVTLDLGAGNDHANIEENRSFTNISSATPKLSVVAGEGDDVVHLADSQSPSAHWTTVNFDLGDGNDQGMIELGPQPAPVAPLRYQITAGAGDDDVVFTADDGRGLDLGVTIDLGVGNDHGVVQVNPQDDFPVPIGIHVFAGAGDDDVEVMGCGFFSVDFELDLGDGSDTARVDFEIDGPIPPDPIEMKATVSGGAGDDDVKIILAALPPAATANFTVDLGTGNDAAALSWPDDPDPFPTVSETRSLHFNAVAGTGDDVVKATGPSIFDTFLDLNLGTGDDAAELMFPSDVGSGSGKTKLASTNIAEAHTDDLQVNVVGDTGDDRLALTAITYTAVLASINLGSGDDSAMLDLAAGVGPSRLTLTLAAGAGSDDIDIKASHFFDELLELDLGADDDKANLREIGGGDPEPSDRRIKMLGGLGNDNLQANISARLADLVFGDFDGGSEGDLIRVAYQEIPSTAVASQELHLHVLGGDDDDDLTLLAATARPTNLLNLLLDGGNGQDHGVATPNVTVINCENFSLRRYQELDLDLNHLRAFIEEHRAAGDIANPAASELDAIVRAMVDSLSKTNRAAYAAQLTALTAAIERRRISDISAPVAVALQDYAKYLTDLNGKRDFPWHNDAAFGEPAVAGLDVNADQAVSPIDVLLIINHINTNPGTGNVPVGASIGGPLAPLGQASYVDVNADNFVVPLDALIVINWINTHAVRLQQAFAEGESHGTDIVIAAFSPVWSLTTPDDSEWISKRKRVLRTLDALAAC